LRCRKWPKFDLAAHGQAGSARIGRRGHASNDCLSAFSEPPSDATWLENARLLDRIFRVAKVMPLGLKMLA
jgi:hypothetical protein